VVKIYAGEAIGVMRFEEGVSLLEPGRRTGLF
jgi:hypothetical protein